MVDNPNAIAPADDESGETPIFWASQYGQTEIVKILAPMTDNPNAPYEDGNTPIYWSAFHGHGYYQTNRHKIFEEDALRNKVLIIDKILKVFGAILRIPASFWSDSPSTPKASGTKKVRD